MLSQILLCLNLQSHVRLVQSWQLLRRVLHSSSCWAVENILKPLEELVCQLFYLQYCVHLSVVSLNSLFCCFRATIYL